MGTNQRAQVTMSDEEIATYIDQHRTAIMASVGPEGRPHVVAMWYAVLDGVIWFETKAKSQKARNLQRNPTLTVLLEDGETYDQLRGVSLEGRATIVDDADALWRVGVDIWERYNGPYSEEVRPLVEVMLHKRVAVRFDVERIRSWDHAKLGIETGPLGGTTAEHLGDRR